MRSDNARRLTGGSLFSIGESGACVDLMLHAGESLAEAEARARALFTLSLQRLALENSAWELKPFADHSGFSVAIGGPIDLLYPLADLVEWVGEQLSQAELSDEAALEELSAKWESWLEAAPRDASLLAAQALAKAQGVPFLWDDEELSFGYGKHSLTLTREAFAAAPPEASALSELKSLPLAMITGTNGKTTTTRMLGRILQAQGWTVGATSTDGLTVDGVLVDAGDWTGPVGARTVLRRTDIDAAILEVARGGLLRRGLAVPEVDVAFVTNVDDDHLGDYGITSVDAMAEVKALVWRSSVKGISVLNVEDARLVALAERAGLKTHPERWILIGRDPSHPLLVAHHRQGERVLTLKEGQLAIGDSQGERTLIAVREIPAALDGAAPHNVANALGAAAIAVGLGVSEAAIQAGLASFGRSPADNPGRLERYHVANTRLLCDFAHNPHGIAAVTPAVWALRKPGSKLWVSIAQAGDRSQEDLEQLVAKTLALEPTELSIRLLGGYERGRPLQEVVDILCEAARVQGFDSHHLHTHTTEPEFLEWALAQAGPEDLVALLVHCERAAVRDFLESKGARPL